MQENKGGALQAVRVLDFANPMGVYCTKLLADLGADVIKVEPPGGDPSRNIPPFFKDIQDPEKSLYWFHFNTNKSSITLNLEMPEGREILKKLVKTADIMVETFPPGYLDDLKIGYPVLREVNPSVVLTSITGFGQTGPWRNFKASDLVGLALGGLLYVCGWPDLPPTRMAGSQAYHQVSVQAAVATLIAYYHALQTQEGQQVDISMQEAIPICIQTRTLMYEKTKEIQKRNGDEHMDAASGVFRCKDGYVDFRLLMPSWDALVKWLDDEGMAGDLKEERWRDPFYRQNAEVIKHIDEIFSAFLIKHSKIEILEEGQKRGFVVGSVDTAAEVARNRHLQARNFFVDIRHPELNTTLKYIGAPYRFSETPWNIKRRAPLIGEHNQDIYIKELGFSRGDLELLVSKKVI